MHHVAHYPPRRHDRARGPATLFRAIPAEPPIAAPIVREAPLLSVSVQVVAGFVAPLPFIQLGHWLFGWPSVAVMWGGQ